MCVAQFAYMNSGQTCIRPDYLIVQYEQLQPFLEHLQTWIKTMHEKDKNCLGKVSS